MTNSNQLDFHEPTLQQVADLCSQFGFTCAGEADLACLRAVLREGFSRWGNHSADASKMVGHQPAPPDEGEVGELVAELSGLADYFAGEGYSSDWIIQLTRAADLLEQRHPEPVPVSEGEAGEESWYPDFADWLEREMPEGTVIGDPLWWASKIADRINRIADLLSQQRHPEPVPVNERPPGDQLCWWFNPGQPAMSNPHIATSSWRLCRMLSDEPMGTHWLPATALPLPAEEPQQ